MNKDLIKVINFGHWTGQKTKKMILEKWPEAEFYEIPVQLNFYTSLVPQVQTIVEEAIRVSGCKRCIPYIILPGVSLASVLVVVMLQGLIGYYPIIIESTKWGFREIHDLDLVKKRIRSERFPNETPA